MPEGSVDGAASLVCPTHGLDARNGKSALTKSSSELGAMSGNTINKRGPLGDHDRGTTRRGAFKKALWGAALATIGVLPAGLWWFGLLPGGSRSRWSLLPPRPIDWPMKPLSSAKIQENTLPDGRVELRIVHDLLHGVTPRMLVWWWRNIEGDMELDGRTYARYLIWHPIDHIYFEVMHRMPDGTVDVGSTFHLVEALGANMRNLLDVMLRLAQLDEGGARAELHVLGRVAMEIQGQFVPQIAGTQIISTMTLGSQGLFGGRLGLNRVLIDWFFPAERRKAWLKHSVEEIGNLQFFLPKLYERHARAM
jgi:hypothetical protein